MADRIASIDAEAAAFERQQAELANAVATCQAEHAAGRIGYEAYLVAKAKQGEVVAAAEALQRRLIEALDTLTGVGKGRGQ